LAKKGVAIIPIHLIFPVGAFHWTGHDRMNDLMEEEGQFGMDVYELIYY
jgi:hypothetical protein